MCEQRQPRLRRAARHAVLLSVVASMGQTSATPNVVTFVIDDMDLERVPFYPGLDEGARTASRALGGVGCRAAANRPLAPSISDWCAVVRSAMSRYLCALRRVGILTGKAPTSSPFYSGTKLGRESFLELLDTAGHQGGCHVVALWCSRVQQ